ncbi:hypothetical protein HDU93_001601 [Gonapodya sp. JEL0774]|nr:hypothetical protein HDU93_001601 [Gonapodya sp. JEL0774]
MQYVRLGNSGLQVSRIALGMMSFGSSQWSKWTLEEEEALPIIKHAFWDTANAYSNGSSEIITGKAIVKYNIPRDRLVIATKVFFPTDENNLSYQGALDMARPIDRHTVNRGGLSRKCIMQEVDKSLKRLGTDYWDSNTPIEETMSALHDLVTSGKVRYIGASSMYAWQFSKAQYVAKMNGWTQFVTMQNHYNILYREEEREMIPLLKDMALRVYSTSLFLNSRHLISQGAVVGKNRTTVRNTTDPINAFFAQSYDNEIIDRIAEISKKMGASPAQVAFAWVLSKPYVHSPIIGASKVKYIDELVDALTLKLSDEDVRYLEERKVRLRLPVLEVCLYWAEVRVQARGSSTWAKGSAAYRKDRLKELENILASLLSETGTPSPPQLPLDTAAADQFTLSLLDLMPRTIQAVPPSFHNTSSLESLDYELFGFMAERSGVLPPPNDSSTNPHVCETTLPSLNNNYTESVAQSTPQLIGDDFLHLEIPQLLSCDIPAVDVDLRTASVSASLSDDALDAYHRFVAPLLPCVHPQMAREGAESPQLLFTLRACGYPYAISTKDPPGTPDAALTFVPEVRRILSDLLLAPSPTTSDIQALLHGVFFLTGMGTPPLSVVDALFGGLVCKLKQAQFDNEMALNTSGLSWMERETRIRIAWCVWSMDKFFCLALARTPLMADEIMSHLPYPCKDALWLSAPRLPIASPREYPQPSSPELPGFAAFVHLQKVHGYMACLLAHQYRRQGILTSPLVLDPMRARSDVLRTAVAPEAFGEEGVAFETLVDNVMRSFVAEMVGLLMKSSPERGDGPRFFAFKILAYVGSEMSVASLRAIQTIIAGSHVPPKPLELGSPYVAYLVAYLAFKASALGLAAEAHWFLLALESYGRTWPISRNLARKIAERVPGIGTISETREDQGDSRELGGTLEGQNQEMFDNYIAFMLAKLKVA